jgi:hypothetical protein
MSHTRVLPRRRTRGRGTRNSPNDSSATAPSSVTESDVMVIPSSPGFGRLAQEDEEHSLAGHIPRTPLILSDGVEVTDNQLGMPEGYISKSLTCQERLNNSRAEVPLSNRYATPEPPVPMPPPWLEDRNWAEGPVNQQGEQPFNQQGEQVLNLQAGQGSK